jgi:flagellar M-ring protein FliF
LHRPSAEGDTTPGMDGADGRSEQEHAVAARLESEVREQLERVVGAGNADVRIHVLLDAANTERTEEYWDKDTIALRSEHLVEEGVDTQQAGVAGVPGARTNLPDANPEGEAPAEVFGGAVGAGVRRARTRNWEVDRVTEKTSLPPGRVERLTAAVLLNGTYNGEGPQAQFVPRSAEQVKALEQVVRRAIGFNEERGDSLVVQAAQFARIDSVDATPLEPPWWRRYALHAAAAAALLFVVCALILVWRSRKQKAQHQQELTQAQQAFQAAAANAQLPGTPQNSARLVEARADDMRELALNVASRDPATAAIVLKKWIATGGESP